METNTLGSRVPIGALSDVETFLNSAGYIKGLMIFRNERRARKSRLDHAIERLIDSHTQVCVELAGKSKRVADLWKLTQQELHELDAAAPAAEPNMSNGGR
jgi:hypothetical protein